MKDFLKFTFATVTGIILVGIVFFFVGMVGIFSAVSSGSAEVVVPKNSVMTLDLSGALVERSEESLESLLASFSGQQTDIYGLDDILSSIEKAKNHENIKGIYLKAGFLGASYASLEAIRNALIDFKESGKFIVAYSDNYTQGLYYLASVADKVLLNPKGAVEWKGVASDVVFFKDLLDKVGVEMQIFKVGTYKSAVEPYISNEMSDANREQMMAYCSSIWNQLVNGVSASRGIPAGELNAIADRMLAFQPAEESVKCGLADTLIYQNDVRDYLKQYVGIEADDDLSSLGLAEMVHVQKNVPKDKSGNIVAVYYAFGEIVDQPTTSLSGSGAIVGNQVIRDLRRLKEDENVKAVVLRVNSPGGSAFASEQIWKAVKDLKAEKPVIVSMGDYAASGGYYISSIADTIVAEPTTLTGSIGIFGMVPNARQLSEKLGVHSDGVKTNKFADFGNLMRPFTADERAIMQHMVEEGYETFVNRCAEGRHMTPEAIKQIAEGRVWTGEMAQKLGLVDVLGGMNDALDIAVRKSGVENYTVVSYPAKQTFLDLLMDSGNTGNYIEAKFLKSKLGSFYEEFNTLQRMGERAVLQARLPYELNVR